MQDRLYRWAQLLETNGVVDFCAHVWSESDVTTRVLETPDGDRNLTDLDHLAQLLQASASGHRPGPVGLLAALELLNEANKIDVENDITARRIESEAAAVQVMTVYAAKGLEFPIVCVPTLWRKSFATAKECIYPDPDTGHRTFDLTNGDPWPTKAEAAVREQLAANEALGENLRLLYVALTRAKHQTIVWWSRASGSRVTGLARLLFARDEAGRLDAELFTQDKVPLPDDAEAIARLAPVFAAAGDAVTITPIAAGEPPLRRGVGRTARPRPPRSSELARLGRALERPHQR